MKELFMKIAAGIYTVEELTSASMALIKLMDVDGKTYTIYQAIL